MKKLILLLTLLFVIFDARGQEPLVDTSKLYTGCKVLTAVSNDTEMKSFIEKKLQLRGVYGYNNAVSYEGYGLAVTVRGSDVIGRAHHIDIDLAKEKTYANIHSGAWKSFFTFWEGWDVHISFGEDNWETIISKIEPLVDRFIDEYLEVNEDACG
ncbi:MAG: hypothetical protein OXE41_10460 [Gammaproteobacteria bacterium]|nr:hypothetical protein [Bacteroidota bacterium]MCY4275796.1 hypothetical protein [Gammaproteobacteria bacterium]